MDQVFRGVDITGLQAPVSGFNQELTLPSCSIPELRLNSVWSNKAMATRTRSCGCPETDRSFWDAQLAEVAKDWLRGPFDSVDEVAQVLGETPHVSRRFPLIQGPKVRGIDDLTESGVNSTFGNFQQSLAYGRRLHCGNHSPAGRYHCQRIKTDHFEEWRY